MSAPQLPPLSLGSLPISIKTTTSSLRDSIERARAENAPWPLADAARCVLEVCVQVADLHVQGVPLRLHPSNIVEQRPGHFGVAREMVTVEATSERDLACVAPELKPGQPGNARATVYAIGAIFYELLTLERVGPGMKRPCDVVPGLPPEIETVLGKALVTNPAYRPDDLYALAQAIHHLTPPGTVPPPPPADESALDNAGSFAVDVSLSLLPPARPRSGQEAVLTGGALPAAAKLNNLPINLGAAIEGLNVAVVHTPTPPTADKATNELAELKARLQADPRPHYVVIKDGMDHGPFSAMELLQQITANTFVESDLVRDSLTGKQETIGNSPDFAPFADHAQRHREIKQEKEAILHVVRQESKSTRSKTLGGLAVLAVVLSGAGVWFLTQRGARNDQLAMKTDTATNVETEGNLNVPQGKSGHGHARVMGTQNGIPMLASGMSCEAAVNAYVEEINMGGGKGQADITQGQYASIMNNGSYFAGCGVPSSTGINICAAVQNGHAVGVTVTTRPNSPGLNSCIAGGVRRISFPAHPKLDVVRVSF